MNGVYTFEQAEGRLGREKAVPLVASTQKPPSSGVYMVSGTQPADVVSALKTTPILRSFAGAPQSKQGELQWDTGVEIHRRG